MPPLTPRVHRIWRLLFSLLALACWMALLLAPLPMTAAPSARIVRVKADGLFANSGNSWAQAKSLQGALQNSQPGDEIWVAVGRYIPSTIDSSFPLTNGVALYGGFAGSEGKREQRNPTLHVTVLSGDMDNDDDSDASGVISDTSDIVGSNAYHIVMASGTQAHPLDSSAVLDGFTITGGDAFGTDSNPCYSCGGGLVLVYASPTLANLVISGNHAGVGGGGMHLFYSSPQMSAITFTGNQAGSDGGAMYLAGSNPIMTNVTFNANQAVQNGGGMYLGNSSPSITKVSFNANRAGYGGGLYNNDNSNPNLTGGAFTRNRAAQNGGGIYDVASNPTLTNVVFNGNRAEGNGGGLYQYQGGTTNLTNIAFAANRALGSGGAIWDFNGNTELLNVTAQGNSADGGGGAFYVSTVQYFNLYNTILWNNVNGELTTDFAQGEILYSLIKGSTVPGAGNLDGADPANDPRFVHPVACGPNGCTDNPATTSLDEGKDDDYGDLRLKSGSPVIDKGENGYTGADTDLAGQPRIAAVKTLTATVDLGAYEYVNVSPDAKAGGPYNTSESGKIALNSSASADDVSISAYAWDCTDDGSIDVSTAIATGSTCTYSNSGLYILRLIVTDNVSATGSATTTVTVANVAPSYTPAPNQSSLAGSAKFFTLGSFTDPGAEGSWPVTIDWGDNISDTLSANGVGSLPTKSHTYAADGSYNVKVTVKDDKGSDNGSFKVTVKPLPPGAPHITAPADQTATTGIDQNFALGSFVDPGSNGPWQVSINWDDGITTTLSTASSGDLPATAHTYAAAGGYDVVVTVSDGTLVHSAGFHVTVGAESNAGSVSGVVFADGNANGTQEGDEAGVGGAKLRLETAGKVSVAGAELARTGASDSNGHYRFDNVPAGDYTLTVIPPAGFATAGVSQEALSVQSGKTTTAPPSRSR